MILQGRLQRLRSLLELAIPVVAGNVGIMVMGLVDLLFVGKVGPIDIGAIGVSHAAFSWVMIFGVGLLAGLEFLMARSFGAGDEEASRKYLAQGLRISLFAGVLLSAALWGSAQFLELFGFNPDVLPKTQRSLEILALGLLPVLGFTTLRIFLQSRNQTREAVIALIAANLLNAALNAVLVTGEWGFPRWEAIGSVTATVASRWLMFLVLIPASMRAAGGVLPFEADLRRMKETLRLGLPSAIQMAFEVGGFAFVTGLAGKLSSTQLAAHQIVLNVASLAFMVPMGISSAAAVRVGQWLGKGASREAILTGWMSFAVAGVYAVFSASVFVFLGEPILSFYTTDSAVLSAGAGLLGLAALFQFSDGAQVVATGVLRGVADTRSPAYANGIGHWLVGVPLGYYLCFVQGTEARGLWMGLSVGLTVVAIMLLIAWGFRARSYRKASD